MLGGCYPRITRCTRFVWPAHTHLAFAAIFFPLVFKKRLADEELFTLDDADRARLEGIEQLLMVDPFSADALKDEYSHPWAEFQTQALFRGYGWQARMALRLSRVERASHTASGGFLRSHAVAIMRCIQDGSIEIR